MSPVTLPSPDMVRTLSTTSTLAESSCFMTSRILFMLALSRTLAAVILSSVVVLSRTRSASMPFDMPKSTPMQSARAMSVTRISRRLYLGFIRLNCAKVNRTTACQILFPNGEVSGCFHYNALSRCQ
ncbi:MAG: hypothetical protein ACLVL7_13230 [Anaerotruncus massiliensis (ex Togo et al. 2019)]